MTIRPQRRGAATAAALALSGTMSVNRIDAIKTKATDPPDASSFNTSPGRATLSLEMVELPSRLSASVSTRYVHCYPFRSGSDWRQIPAFVTPGVSAAYRLPARGTTLLLQVDNLIMCVSGPSVPPAAGIGPSATATYAPGNACGSGLRHHEILNTREFGTIAFVGVRWKGR